MLHLIEVAALLTYIILFVTPLIVIPGLNLRFEPPKAIFVQFIIELLVVAVFLSGKFNFKKANNLLISVMGSFFILSLFHLYSNPGEKSLFGNIFRLQGTVLFWHFLMLTLIAQNIYFRLQEKYIYLAGFIAICIGALLFEANSAGRLIGSLGEPNALGAVVILMLPFVLLSFKNLWIRIICVLSAIVVINFTESKSALIALGLEMIFILLVKLFKGKILPGFLVCIMLLILSLGLPIMEREYFLRTNTDPLNFRFEDRAQIWQVALKAGLASPIYGTGLDSIQDRIHTTAEQLNINAQYQVIDSSHNIFLDFWVWGGGVGVGLLSLLIVLTLKNLVQKKMILETGVFIGLLTVLSFNPTTVSVLAGFWWVIGRSFAKLEGE